MSQHICILTSAHPLDDVRVNSKIAASFLGRGFKVSWVGPENSSFADVADWDNRISYHLTPPIGSRFDRLTSARRVARKAREVRDVDWYYCPDPDAAEVAVKLASSSTAKVLFDIHEIFHGALIDRWLFGRRASLVRHYVRSRVARTARRSDLVMGVSESVLRPYVAEDRPSLRVRNCAPRWFADRAVARDLNRPSVPMTFMHGLGLPSRGTAVVLHALASLGIKADVARVVIFHSTNTAAPLYMPSLTAEIAELHLGHAVWLHEAVKHEDIPSVLAQCDVGLVAYGRGLGEDSLPNRLFEYMASGLAVLAPSYAVEIVRIIDDENIGLTVDFEDPAEVAGAMRWFIEHPEETKAMGARARTAFVERHNWDAEFDRLLDAMAHV